MNDSPPLSAAAAQNVLDAREVGVDCKIVMITAI